MAVIHDLGEAATGEIATGVKNWIDQLFTGQKIMERVEQGLMAALVANVAAKEEISGLLAEFDDGKTVEAKVAKFADVFDAFAEAKEKLKRTFPAYLKRQRQKLGTADDSEVQKAGRTLAMWLGSLEDHWDDIKQERPWANTPTSSQQGGPANGSQPSRSRRTRTSSAAGSRR
jgi:5'-deoxynucleotidase YfbR-like HD superfamily hydrolase